MMLFLLGAVLLGSGSVLPELGQNPSDTTASLSVVEWKGFSLSLIWKIDSHQNEVMTDISGPFLKVCDKAKCDTLAVGEFSPTESLSASGLLPLKFRSVRINKDSLALDLRYNGLTVILVQKANRLVVVKKTCNEQMIWASASAGINADSISGTIDECEQTGRWQFFLHGILVGERNFANGVKNGAYRMLDMENDGDPITIIRGQYCKGKRCGQWFYCSVVGEKDYSLYGYLFRYDSVGRLMDSGSHQSSP